MQTTKKASNNIKKIKDPYLKPVIFGGLTTALLSIIFAPGIFLWAIIGGYVAVRLTNKLTKETVSTIDSFLLGLFSGIIGATCLNLITVISFNNSDNQRILIRTLEKNWPKDLPIPELSNLLPKILIITCILIVVVAILFSIIGSYIGFFLTKRKKKT